jgi:hypothetical protein
VTLPEMEGDTSTPTALGQLDDGTVPEGPRAIRFTSATLVTARPSESETALDASVADSRNLILSAWRVIAGC